MTLLVFFNYHTKSTFVDSTIRLNNKRHFPIQEDNSSYAVLLNLGATTFW